MQKKKIEERFNHEENAFGCTAPYFENAFTHVKYLHNKGKNSFAFPEAFCWKR